jgi:carbamate kinase
MEGAYPLDVLDAESEGMVGYLIEQQLDNALPSGRLVATLLTQILVDRRDPAFRRPTKPIGPIYDKAQAEKLAQARGAGPLPRMKRAGGVLLRHPGRCKSSKRA